MSIETGRTPEQQEGPNERIDRLSGDLKRYLGKTEAGAVNIDSIEQKIVESIVARNRESIEQAVAGLESSLQLARQGLEQLNTQAAANPEAFQAAIENSQVMIRAIEAKIRDFTLVLDGEISTINELESITHSGMPGFEPAK